MSFNRIRIVLVEPAGPLNVGSVARVMKNMGLHQLVLVNPDCDPLDPEARMMAVHAADLLEEARIVPSLAVAVADCRRIVGTMGRLSGYPPEWLIESPRLALPWLLSDPVVEGAIVFGSEDRGLSNQELSLCHRQVRIPTADVYPSLNLAQAVAVCAYELYITSLDRETPPSTAPASTLAPSLSLESFYHHLEATLLDIGYLQPQTAERKLLKFRALFNRAQLSLPEIALLRGILRQLGWAKAQFSPLARKEDPALDKDS